MFKFRFAQLPKMILMFGIIRNLEVLMSLVKIEEREFQFFIFFKRTILITITLNDSFTLN